MATLREWATVGVDAVQLKGRVYGHPDSRRNPDGRRIVTSRVVEIIGDKILTFSGTIYMLVGMPEPGYEEFLASLPSRDLTQPLARLVDTMIRRAKAAEPAKRDVPGGGII